MTAMPPPGAFAEDLLSAYLDGELDPDGRAQVEAALAGSETLRAVLIEVGEARLAVRDLSWPEAPAGFWDQVIAAVAAVATDPAIASARVVAMKPRRRWDSRRVLVATGAAAAIALVAGIALVPPSDTQEVRLAVPALVDAHATRMSINGDPISALAPIAVPVSMAP